MTLPDDFRPRTAPRRMPKILTWTLSRRPGRQRSPSLEYRPGRYESSTCDGGSGNNHSRAEAGERYEDAADRRPGQPGAPLASEEDRVGPPAHRVRGALLQVGQPRDQEDHGRHAGQRGQHEREAEVADAE